ncbi:WD40-repeat-containing domain protein [Suillus americanus]|nr:WD40-repeat-containing domain protein [Suillus americanus]
MTLIVTGGRDGPSPGGSMECSIKIWDAKTSKLVATLKGHTWEVCCLAWTNLISGSYDFSIRTWNTQTWKQTAVLDEHGGLVIDIAISPNGRILASASLDNTARLWNLDNGQPISSPLQHSEGVHCISFSADGKLLATACESEIAYAWDVATIVREAGFNDLLLDSKAKKLALRAGATRNPVQRRPPAYRMPQGFFDGVPPNRSHSLARSHSHSSAQPGSTFLTRLFHRNPSDNHDTSPFSPLEWVRNLLQLRGQSGEGAELQGRSPAVIEVPYAHGQRRNACAREKRKRLLLPLKNPTASSSQPPKPNTTQQSGTATQTKPSLQPQPSVSNSSTTPAVGDNTAATTSVPSHPDVILRQAGLWTRFWLFVGCLSPEYQDGRH